MTIAHPLRTGAGPRAADHTARTTPPAPAGVAGLVAAEGAGAERTGALAARTWAADAALGAGLVLFALGAEHLGDHVVLAAILITWGAAETLWAVLALRGPAPLPRSALAVLLVGAAGWVVVQPATRTTIGTADLAVVVLQLAAAMLLAARLRAGRVGAGRGNRATGGAATPVAVGAGRQLAVMAAGALVVATVTVPGLAATNAGAHAVPHSEHSVSWLGGGHHHG
ncbi:hypothetical protein IC607_00215 [Cellulomonas sp. JH27-2]|uniref:hypothetical protein n=1 Tax=Cellulomonas sp. JH27-2 TaxID=2774139 RepID=UPI00177E4D62|nr:hypothetical protein [Cellulomonas sp. JH27-2]MBD8057395.1 hypothetical protein [Cellulomonas sp. JH27-2]